MSPKFLFTISLHCVIIAAAVLCNSVCYSFLPTYPIKRTATTQHHPTSVLFAVNGGRFRVFGTIGNVARGATKAVLPKRWTQSKEERQMQLTKTSLKNDIHGNLTQILKDAPRSVRILGKVLIPVISGIAASATNQLQSQNQTIKGLVNEQIKEVKREFQEQFEEENRKKRRIDLLLSDAKIYSMADPTAREALGEPIVDISFISQCSNTVMINGSTSTFIPLFQFFVVGSKDQGFVTMKATDNGITSMSISMPNRSELIYITPSTSSTGILKGLEARLKESSIYAPDDIIDVELIGPN